MQRRATLLLIIALESGHEIRLRLISEGGTGITPVDFVVNYQPAQSFLITSTDSATAREEPAAKSERPSSLPSVTVLRSNTPSTLRLPGQENQKRQLRHRRGLTQNTTDERSALEKLKVWVTSGLPALQVSGATSIVGVFEMR
jgi:hypothetical protein